MIDLNFYLEKHPDIQLRAIEFAADADMPGWDLKRLGEAAYDGYVQLLMIMWEDGFEPGEIRRRDHHRLARGED
jgi:hypothetical protein